MSEVESRQPASHAARPTEVERERSDDTSLIERAPADAIEPALVQSGNPPRAFVKEDR